MAAKPKVVIGEAPESDSEDELNIADGVAVSSTESSKGRVIAGEAPESDDENIGKSSSLDSVSSALSASAIITSSDKKASPQKEQSLLSKKLYEKNVSLAKNISDLVTTTVHSANNELNTVDQHLLKCQVQVQEADDLLKKINENVSKLEQKLRTLLACNHIPDISIPNNV